jgi:NADH-quinone oxidoreductase subunit A
VQQEPLLAPPVAFLVMLLAAIAVSFGFSRLAFKRKRRNEGVKPYACGEDIPTHMIQPNYAQFLPFAFFFTILHVVVLTLATVPVLTSTAFVFAGLYILGAMLGLAVLYGK